MCSTLEAGEDLSNYVMAVLYSKATIGTTAKADLIFASLPYKNRMSSICISDAINQCLERQVFCLIMLTYYLLYFLWLVLLNPSIKLKEWLFHAQKLAGTCLCHVGV